MRMLKNYLKVAFRALTRNKLSSAINISGLALALTCTVLLYLFIRDELAYDKFHGNHERIYRVTRSFHSPEGVVNLHLSSVAPPIGPLLKNDFGRIEKTARALNYNLVIGVEENGKILTVNNEPNLFLVEPDIFDIFDFHIVSGNPATSLIRPFTVMLSEETAKKYFNTTEVIGKRMRANNQFDLEVTGVFRELPAQSHWHPQFLVSFSTLEDDNVYGREQLETNWGNNSFLTYLLLEKGADPAEMEQALPEFINKHFGNFVRGQGAPADFVASKVTTLHLQRVTDIHLHSHLDDELEANGDITNVYMMTAIGVFILIIACFNFINLSTARATKRAKEVGLRKVVGAFRLQLVFQYLNESILIALLALTIAIALSAASLGWLNDFTGKNLSIDIFRNAGFMAGMFVFTILLGCVAGAYPAFVISAFRPAVTLKGPDGSAKGKLGLRRVLVVSQFAISIVLIIATVITFQQLRFLQNESLGYTKEHVITLPYYNELAEVYNSFYNQVTASTLIENIGQSSRVPTGRLLDSFGSARIVQGDSLVGSAVNLRSVAIDEEFFDTYSIGFLTGRNFSKDIPTDDSLAFIINESAAKALGWKIPEEHINEDFQYAGYKGKLAGIVKDFHFESLHQPIASMIFVNRNNFNTLSVRVAAGRTTEALEFLEKTWKEFLPGRPFTYQFLSQSYAKLYTAERKQGQLFTVFSGLAIFIASLGLFGLATFSTTQRIKEIGIRKVLGASVPDILALLSREIIILILLSNLLAWPIAWYFMNSWLSTFAYHIDMNPIVYILSAMAALALAVLTVSFQTIRAATGNPASTLKYE